MSHINYPKLLASMEAGAAPHGYTIDEIKAMQAYTQARIEVLKGALIQAGHNLVETGSVTGQRTWVRRLLGCFSYFDYALVAYKLISGIGDLRRLRRR